MALPPFSTLLDEHRGALWRHLVASVGAGEAGDVYQETVLAALRAYPQLRHGENLRGWLFTIAHHKVIDAHRARARRPEPVGSVPEGEPGAEAEPVDRRLWAAVARLPDKQRHAVVQRFVADLPYAEVGTIVGCSEAAARQNVRAGLARLREEINRGER